MRVAANALQYAKELMPGLRKDGVTPSFHLRPIRRLCELLLAKG